MKPAARLTITAVCLGASGLALLNVYGDNSDVKRLAEQTACKGPCVKMIREERSAFSQQFEFQNSIEHQTTAKVSCQRKWLLVGPYVCE